MMSKGVRYGRGRAKRVLDLALSIPAVIVLSPVLGILAIVILLTSGPPVIFEHERVGMDGRMFRVRKFRSMRSGASSGLPITGGSDPRITHVGRILRATKLDELPQLFNILAGEMSIVGPRPEVPRYVALYDEKQSEVLSVRPGLTDPASIVYRHEETLLGAVPADQREAFYIREVMPRKLALNLEYISTAGPIGDLGIILKTVMAVLGRGAS